MQSPQRMRREKLVAKIRLKLRRKVEAQIAAKVLDEDVPQQATDSGLLDILRTHGSRESDTYSKDSIAHLEKSRVNKYNRDHHFDILQKSTQWIKIQREKKQEKIE